MKPAQGTRRTAQGKRSKGKVWSRGAQGGVKVTGIFDQNEPAQGGLNFRQKIVVILMNLFLLAELTFSIFLSSHDRENMAAIFLTTFVPMVIVTLGLARVLVRRMGDRPGSD
jgi:hypothetical protein